MNKANDFILGNLFISNNCFQKIIPKVINTEIEIKEFSKENLNIKSNFIELESYEIEDDSIKIFFPYFKKNFTFELENRQKNRNYFTEEELIEISSNLIKSLNFLHEKKKIYKEFSPESIVFNQNSWKLLSQNLIEICFIEDKNGIRRKNWNEKKKYYTSNEELKNEENIDFNEKILNDFFKLGLILLEASIFFPIFSCVNFEEKEINYNFVKKKLGIVEKRYSHEFSWFLGILLGINKINFEFTDLIEEIFYKNQKDFKENIKKSPCFAPENKYKKNLSYSFLTGVILINFF